MLRKVIFPLLLISAFGLSIYFVNTMDRKHQGPNILFIMVDDLGYGDLASYGAKDMRTPNIDALMQAGMRLDNFYANCPVCSPTRAALMTGCYPDLAGVPGVIRTHDTNSWGYLSTQIPTLAETLKKARYQTAIIGKWHLGLESPNTPTERGFDFFHGFLGDMMDDYYTHLRHEQNYMRLNTTTIEPEGHATDLFTNWAIDYLNKKENDTNPWFLYLAYNAPHDPIQPPTEWLNKVKTREDSITDRRANLVAFIEHLDDGIGKVINNLKENGQYDNTLIVFTSDNGGALRFGANNGALRGGKQDMYEGGLKVPTCVVWKDSIQAGSRSNNMGLTMDFYPTLCSIAGAEWGDHLNGTDLSPTLRGKSQRTDDRTVFWMRREGHVYGGQIYYGARNKNFKLVQNTPYEDIRLFDLGNDPLEKLPLTKENEMHKKLYKELTQHIRAAGGVPWQGPE